MNRLLIILFALIWLSAALAEGNRETRPAKSTVIGDLDTMYINNIYLPYQNDGSTAEDAQAYFPNPGLPVPPGYNLSFLFQGGITATGYVNGVLRASWMAKASLIQEWQAGKWGMNPQDPLAIFYNVNNSSGPGSLAYQKWADAVSLGANFHDLNGDGVYDPNVDRPDILGDRTSWCVINDSTDMSIRSVGLQTEPMGLEIHQTVWAFAMSNEIGNMVFFRYRLINADISDIDDFIFSIWTDPDIGEATDDLIGCDTTLNTGYCYNSGSDPVYGSNPPAFGVTFLQGPVVESPGDTAYHFRGPWFGTDTLAGMKNLPLTAFTFYNNAVEPDPFPSPVLNAQRARDYQEGGKNGYGDPIDPTQYGVGGLPSDDPKFFYSGDPVTQTGWRNNVESDKRFLANCGPFQLAAGDTQDIIITYVVGQGDSALGSITQMRHIILNYIGPIGGIEDQGTPVISKFRLYQNYPNPFNPSTSIGFYLNHRSKVQLAVFNVLGERVAILVNNTLNVGEHIVQFDAPYLPSGVYFYRLSSVGFSQTKKMILMR
jgi:hypothetical protein